MSFWKDLDIDINSGRVPGTIERQTGGVRVCTTIDAFRCGPFVPCGVALTVVDCLPASGPILSCETDPLPADRGWRNVVSLWLGTPSVLDC